MGGGHPFYCEDPHPPGQTATVTARLTYKACAYSSLLVQRCACDRKRNPVASSQRSGDAPAASDSYSDSQAAVQSVCLQLVARSSLRMRPEEVPSFFIAA